MNWASIDSAGVSGGISGLVWVGEFMGICLPWIAGDCQTIFSGKLEHGIGDNIFPAVGAFEDVVF